MAVIGEAYVQLVPLTGTAFAEEFKRQIAEATGPVLNDPALFAGATATAEKAGEDAAASVGTGLKRGAEGMVVPLGAAGKKGGEALGKGLSDGVKEGGDAVEHDVEEAGSKVNDVVKGMLERIGKLASVIGLPLDDLGDRFDKLTQKTGVFGGKLGGVSLAGAGVFAALVGVSAVSTKMGSDFETSTAALAANAGITIKQANAIGQAFLHSGTDVTHTAQEQVDAYTQVSAQLGEVTGHALTAAQAQEFMKQSMDLAEESGSKLGSTTTDLAKLMQAFQVPLKGVNDVATSLYNTSGLTNTSIDALSQTMVSLKTRLGVTSPSVQELSTFMLDLADHGVSGQRGLMLLNGAMNSLLASTDKVKNAQASANATYGKEMTSAQAAVTAATEKLAAAQGKVGAASQLAASQSAAASQTQKVAAESAAAAVAKAEVNLQAAQERTTTTAAQEQAKRAAIAKAQIDLSVAQQKQAEVTAQAQDKAGVAAVQSGQKQAASAASITSAQNTLAAAQQKLSAIQAAGAHITNVTAAGIAALGLHVYTAQGTFVGMGSIIAQLQPKLAGLTQQQQLHNLALVFGNSASKSLLETVLAGPAAYEKAQKAVTDQAAAHHALVVQQQTLTHELDAAKVQIIDLATRFGIVLLPAVKDVTHWFAEFLGFLMSHKDVLYAVGAAIGVVLTGAVLVFAAAVGKTALDALVKWGGQLLHWISFGKLGKAATDEQTEAVKKQAAATEKLAEQQKVASEQMAESQRILADAIKGTAAATEKLVGQMQQLLDRMPAVDEMTTGTSGTIDEMAASLRAAGIQADLTAGELQTFIDASTETAAVLDTEFQASVDAATASLGGLDAALGVADVEEGIALAPILLIIAAVAALGFAIYELVTHWKTVWRDIVGAAEAAWHFITHIFRDGILGDILSIIFPLVGLLTHWKEVFAAMKAVAGAVWDGIKRGFDDFVAFIKKWGPLVGEIILAPFTGGMSLLIPLIIRHWAEVKRLFDDFIDFVKKWGLLIVEVIAAPFTLGLSLLIPLLVRHWADVEKWFGDAVRWVDDHVVQPIVNFFTGLPGKISRGLTNILHDVTQPFADIVNWIIQHVIDPIVHAFEKLPADIAKAVAGIPGKIGDAIKSGVKHIPVIGSFLAEGGPATIGQPYIVGEKGPELFVPGTSGTVISNAQWNQAKGAFTGKGPGATPGGGGGGIGDDLATQMATIHKALTSVTGDVTAFGKAILDHIVVPLVTATQKAADFGIGFAKGLQVLGDVAATAKTFGPGLVSSLVGALQKISDEVKVFAPAFVKGFDGLNKTLDLVKGFGKGLVNEIEDPLDRTAKKISGFGDDIKKGIVDPLSHATDKLSDFESRLGKIAEPLNKAAVSIAAFGPAVTVGVKSLEAANQEVKSFGPHFTDAIVGALKAVSKAVDDFGPKFKDGLKGLATAVDDVKQFKSIFEKNVVDPLGDGAKAADHFTSSIDGITKPLEKVEAAMKAFGPDINAGLLALQEADATVKKFGPNFTSEITNALKAVTNAMAAFGPKFKDGMKALATGLSDVDQFKQRFQKDVVGPLNDGKKAASDFGKALTTDLATPLTTATKDMQALTIALPAVVKAFQNLKPAVDNAAPSFAASMKALDQGADPAKTLAKSVDDIGKNMVDADNAAKDLKPSLDKATDSAKTMADKTADAATNIRNLGTDIVGLKDKINNNMPTAATNVENAFKDVPGWIRDNVVIPIGQYFAQLPAHIQQVLAPLKGILQTAFTPPPIRMPPMPSPAGMGVAIPPAVGKFQEGGMVPGSGEKLAVVHGGEVVLSTAQVAKLIAPAALTTPGTQISPGSPLAAITANLTAAQIAGGTASGAVGPSGTLPGQKNYTFYNTFVTPANDPNQISNEIGWMLRVAPV